MITPTDLSGLADTLRRLRPSCGPVRLVAVDGHAGSGKTTFTARLMAALGGAPVLPLDELATHEEPFEWTGRMRRQVLDPLRRGTSARYQPYDWHARRFGPPRTLPAAPVVLVEGVGSGRAALRPELACLLWMEMAREDAWRRGRRRDGPALEAFWDGWTDAELRHFAADPSRPFAHLLVRQDDYTNSADGTADTADTNGPDGTASAAAPERTARLAPGGPVCRVAYRVLAGPAGGVPGTGPCKDSQAETHST